MSDSGFDRLRRRSPSRPATMDIPQPRPADPDGRRALYSVAEQPPAPGAVTIQCSVCDETSAVTPRGLLGLALPSVHLPVLRRRHASWMRCPACGRRTWVRVGLRI